MLIALRNFIGAKSTLPFIGAVRGYNLTQTCNKKKLGIDIDYEDWAELEQKRITKDDVRPRIKRFTARQRDQGGAKWGGLWVSKNSRFQFSSTHQKILKGQAPVTAVKAVLSNTDPRKKSTMKPTYTVEEQISYMHSKGRIADTFEYNLV